MVENEYIEFQKLRHENMKEILEIKEQMNQRSYERKTNFALFLYDLKNKYLEKEEASHLKKMFVLNKIKSGEEDAALNLARQKNLLES